MYTRRFYYVAILTTTILTAAEPCLAGSTGVRQAATERIGFSFSYGNGYYRSGHAVSDEPVKAMRFALLWTDKDRSARDHAGLRLFALGRAVYVSRPLTATRYVDIYREGSVLVGGQWSLYSLIHASYALGLGIANGTAIVSHSSGNWFSGPYWSWSTIENFTAVCLPYEFSVMVTPVPWAGVSWNVYGNKNTHASFGGSGLTLSFLFPVAPSSKVLAKTPERNPWAW